MSSRSRAGGNIFTGVELEVSRFATGQTAVAMDRLVVGYSPVTMISEGSFSIR